MQNKSLIENEISLEKYRQELNPEEIRAAFFQNLHNTLGRLKSMATDRDLYMALAYTVRDKILYRWLYNVEQHFYQDVKIVTYLSAEYLLGPHLINNLINLGIYDQVRTTFRDIGIDIKKIAQEEEEPGLGNGGLGRLAACFMDSLTTLSVPAIGYGIRYEFGIFNQLIQDGWQIEMGDKWLFYGNPWEIPRPQFCTEVMYGGHTEKFKDEKGLEKTRWVPFRVVRGIPYDTPIIGYGGHFANLLRLWKAEAHESFDFQAFNVGDYMRSVGEKMDSENISKVLYPNDEPKQGKKLRLEQEYFFVSCSIQDMIRIHLLKHSSVETLPATFASQLNDTHPALAIPEMMRLLIDIHNVDWNKAFEITQKIFSYTNHTILPEALEKWSVALLKEMLPRHLEIIFEINYRFLNEVNLVYPGDIEKQARLSIIDENGEKNVRMAHLACIGCHTINGVAKLHTKILTDKVLHDFYGLEPSKFKSITNGVSPRRWILLANPNLAALITRAIGDKWITQAERLQELEKFIHDSAFYEDWQKVKLENKKNFTEYGCKGGSCNIHSLFDVQVKRIHEYKRQHLNILHIITLYHRIKKNPSLDVTPRTFIFGGKAAPSYMMAKLFIKLIHSVSDVVSSDPDTSEKIRAFFIPNFNVTVGQKLYPVADLSEQISLAGNEASGTGNMKFSFNGALTIGTLDGANIEIREKVGPENFFLFGLTAEEAQATQIKGYHPWDYYHSIPSLKEAIDSIASGLFSKGDKNLFKPFVDALLTRDRYMCLADYQSYIDCHEKVDQTFRNKNEWTRMSILNVARMGSFSSDRAIKQYCSEVWHVKPVQDFSGTF